jgi:hypothetical protein
MSKGLRQVSFFLLRLQIAACKRIPKYLLPCSWTEMALSGGGMQTESWPPGFPSDDLEDADYGCSHASDSDRSANLQYSVTKGCY